MGKAFTFNQFKLGMDNIHTAEELSAADPQSGTVSGLLRDALNVDLTDTGNVKRKKGYTLRTAGDWHSVWSNGSTALGVLNGDLVLINSNDTTTVLHAGVSTRAVSYAEVNNEIYYSNGVVTGKVVNKLRQEWGVEDPGTPALASTTGLMYEGRYQAACTFVSSYGEEGGAVRSNGISLTTGGLAITAPAAVSAEVTRCRIYLTKHNEETFYLVAEIAPGTSITFIEPPPYGVDLTTLHMKKMIPGDMLEYYRGRMYATVGNIVWPSQNAYFGLYNPAEDYLQFSEQVDMVKAVEDGLYIASEATYFYAGNGPEDFTVREVMPAKVAYRSASNVPKSTSILWYSERGLVVGADGGQIKNVQENKVRPGPAVSGVTMTKEQGGLMQHIGVGKNAPHQSVAGVGDVWETEIIRRQA